TSRYAMRDNLMANVYRNAHFQMLFERSRRDLPPPSFTPSSCLTSTLSPAIKTPIKRPLRFYWCTVYTGAHIVQDGAAGKPFPAH
uniref:Uncharacterized protein n=1 Tax=Gadus morhua TaxID=8049 RepID=A0A8C5ATB6_GADMO